MGNKRALLSNGLGSAIRNESRRCERFVDLFSGSGAVSAYASEQTPLPVYAVDLQAYAVKLAEAVVVRTEPADADDIERRWLDEAEKARVEDPRWASLAAIDRQTRFGAKTVKRARELAAGGAAGSMLRAYGGHYFSPAQALTLDHMLAAAINDDAGLGALCAAATIQVGSRCAAAPGHTAQPFQPTKSALPFIRESWSKDPVELAREAIAELAPRHARAAGEVERANAVEVAATLESTDLAFVDPPYSAVQYSRFYHVLEALALGQADEVEGVGRYGPIEARPKSDFSLRTRSLSACTSLLDALRDAGCRVIFTFPAGASSNGLSGADVLRLAGERFKVESVGVHGRFSTLGGNGEGRAARKLSEELIITMRPRSRRRSAG